LLFNIFMFLFFIRHGQSANNALYDETFSDIDRVSDPELTPTGLLQAARVAETLRTGEPLTNARATGHLGFGVTHLYSSLMVRAVHTGQFISKTLGLPLNGWTDIHEGGGIFLEDPASRERIGLPGNSRALLTARFPELVWPADAQPEGWWNRPFEPNAVRSARARRVLAQLLAHHGGTDDRVALVAHGGFFYRFMCAALGMPTDPENINFHVYNTAITCLEFTPNGVTSLRYLNRVDHLPGELIT
jgi:2,3-bisphosphoglycerate-dependent phosphoglycerate mutase